MKYIIYTRQSKPSRKSKIIPLSHETQKQKCLDILPKDGEKIFIMDPSGADNDIMKRKMFRDTLDLVNRHDIIVVYSLDRLSRDFYQMGYIKTVLEMKGASLLSATEKDIDRTMLGFTAVMSDSQKQQIRMKTKDALQRLKSLGYRVGTIPYGYQLGEAQKIVANEKEQIVLVKMEASVAQGDCLRDIAQTLRKDGIYNRKGKPFSHVSIHKILRNAPSHREAYLESPALHQHR
jgi:DNA invertase Pin-like site-specific DNA recombinase